MPLKNELHVHHLTPCTVLVQIYNYSHSQNRITSLYTVVRIHNGWRKWASGDRLRILSSGAWQPWEALNRITIDIINQAKCLHCCGVSISNWQFELLRLTKWVWRALSSMYLGTKLWHHVIVSAAQRHATDLIAVIQMKQGQIWLLLIGLTDLTYLLPALI